MVVEKLIIGHIDTWTTALQTRSTVGRGSSGKIDLYGIKKLRELILELAVRGKLVPQDPNDEPASELLKRIAQEKVQLVKDGKVKKQKPLPPISDEEKPFELPEGWEWARLPEITHYQVGKTPSTKDSNFWGSHENGIPWVSISDLVQNSTVEITSKYVSKKAKEDIFKYTPVPAGTILMSFKLTVGKTSLLNIDAYHNEAIISIYEMNGLNRNYLFHLLPLISQLGNTKQAIMGNTLNSESLSMLVVPVPSTKEQIRIVKKYEELMSLCDQLERHSLTSLDAHQQLVETLLTTLTDSQNADELAENWARISEHFDTLFTTEASIDALKQTILQLAVMGKLVAQDPNDEPASELLKRIAQEKAKLVEEGKIKKQKPLPPISDEEKPFELPDGWEWVKLGNILHDIKYGTSQKCDYNIAGYPVLRIPNIVKGIIDLADIKYGALTDSELKDLTLNKNDLLFIRSNGSTNIVGQSILVQHDLKDHAYAGYIIRVRLHNEYINARYINMVMKSNLIREQIEGPIRTTTGVKNINSNELMGLLVPLPPKNEQGIIIKQINNIDTTLSNLKVSIQSAQQNQLHLADALTGAAIN
ncbi:restriction endonuclease subunit S [Salmonella enterica subsp. enterica serovar Muenchen]|uniref:restriction endonuclease subunit S n=1 Tax=Salmonella enterica TaxID=28901 RepID=UPI001F0EC836|nr:restriction endonuclease subunit S [Salmonella enterica]EEJ6214834.1 restriction endonuclease subunit S [Salmonella enterica]MCH5442722.1 restriction endonuclease subunit S [Salmonella enterica subsp. enterica serovar Muenchen]